MGDWRKVIDKGNLKHNLPAGGTGQWKDTASEHQLGLTALLWTGGGGGRGEGGREVEREVTEGRWLVVCVPSAGLGTCILQAH